MAARASSDLRAISCSSLEKGGRSRWCAQASERAVPWLQEMFGRGLAEVWSRFGRGLASPWSVLQRRSPCHHRRSCAVHLPPQFPQMSKWERAGLASPFSCFTQAKAHPAKLGNRAWRCRRRRPGSAARGRRSTPPAPPSEWRRPPRHTQPEVGSRARRGRAQRAESGFPGRQSHAHPSRPAPHRPLHRTRGPAHHEPRVRGRVLLRQQLVLGAERGLLCRQLPHSFQLAPHLVQLCLHCLRGGKGGMSAARTAPGGLHPRHDTAWNKQGQGADTRRGASTRTGLYASAPNEPCPATQTGPRLASERRASSVTRASCAACASSPVPTAVRSLCMEM